MYFPDLEKYGKNESRVWKNICVSRLLPLFSYFLFYIIQKIKNLIQIMYHTRRDVSWQLFSYRQI